MITSYTYLISGTANNKVAHDSLSLEIRKEENITIKLLSSSDDGTNITLTFADAVPAEQKSPYLDDIVTAHLGKPLTYTSKVENMLPIGGPRMSNRGVQFVCTAGQSQYVDYTVTEDLHVRSGILITDKQVVGDVFDIELYHPLDLINPLWIYAENEPVIPTGITDIHNEAITETSLNGLIIRFTYHSSGVEDVKCVIGMRASMIV